MTVDSDSPPVAATSTGREADDGTTPQPETRAGQDGLGLPARLGLAFFCGLAYALAFPPFGVSWLALLAPAGLVLLCRGVRPRRGAATGLAFGLGFFGLLLKWTSVLGVDAWLALSAIEASFLAIFGALAAVVTRLRW
ncbi:MAG TPA: hypothetical protein VI076_13910, partial [Actinopolymorphaceae bacterium]